MDTQKGLDLDAIKNKPSVNVPHTPSGNMQKVNIEDILPYEKKVDEAEARRSKLEDELDTGLKNAKSRFSRDLIEPQREAILEALQDKELGENVDIAQRLAEVDEAHTRNPEVPFEKNEALQAAVREQETEAIDPSLLADEPPKIDHKAELDAKMKDLGSEISKYEAEEEAERAAALAEVEQRLKEKREAKMREKAERDAEEEKAKLAKAEAAAAQDLVEAKKAEPDIAVSDAILKERIEDAQGTAKETLDSLSDGMFDLDLEEQREQEEKEAKLKMEREKLEKSLSDVGIQYESTVIKQDLLDLSTFRISKKPVSASKLLATKMSESRVSVWGLYHTGQSIAMSEFGGPELETITKEMQNEDMTEQVHMYQLIYSHVIDKNKGDFESWCKRIIFPDLPHLFFSAFKASFKGSNFHTFNCTDEKCSHIFMTEVDMAKMVKYETEETKKRMHSIIAGDTTSKPTYTQKIIQISPELAVCVTLPTLYKIIFEQRVLSPEFRENNEEIMNILTYIDDIYSINATTKTLDPIDTRPDPDNHNLTIKRRVSTFGKIINGLDSDRYAYLKSKVAAYSDDLTKDGITYLIPDVECPECHGNVVGRNINPIELLFLRHRLGRALSFIKN